MANGATTVSPGPTSCSTVALAPTVAPSCKVIGPITIAPAPTRTRSPSVGLPFASNPMVTCWLIQQWLPMDSAHNDRCDTVLDEESGRSVRVEDEGWAGRYTTRSRKRSASGAERRR